MASSLAIARIAISTRNLRFSSLRLYGTINAERLERLQKTAARLITGTHFVENVPREILLARAGLDKLADCRKIKCGIFAVKLAFRKNSNCLPRQVLEAAKTWLSLSPDRISDMNSRSQSRTAAIRLPRPQTNTMKSSPFYFCFSVLNSVPLDNLKSEASVKEYLLSCQLFNLHVHSISLIVPFLSCLFLLSSFTLALARGSSNE